ncbi:hypothetical protein RFI_28602 [Reticulomyxa filosa]|uniref:Caspase family p20 domain-containing protein n=1 Tax=Reticulomyxa filosa TaxID=46433 RepID=X6M576_RETFI|nr:hypothetical protein RFI_28602 [Reticulomyxa filosa]|eukprot:ETO08781.1 hypothetical protein RFI_28602 [Reticulomyxa filosa]
MINETKKDIKMDTLTYLELYRQIHGHLDWKEFAQMQKMKSELRITDDKDRVIACDKDVESTFKSNEPLLKTSWRSQTNEPSPILKVIRNACVAMIAISKYSSQCTFPNLPNVKEKVLANYKEIFQNELKYDFVCNENAQMTQEDVQDFFTTFIREHKLRKNHNLYDALIIIFCGHGTNGKFLVTSEGEQISIDEFRATFAEDKIPSFKNCLKFFIIDMCQSDNNLPNTFTKPEPVDCCNDNGVFTISSFTKLHLLNHSSLLSNYLKNTMLPMLKNSCPLKQILRQIRRDTQKSVPQFYVESQDSALYDFTFAPKQTDHF